MSLGSQMNLARVVSAAFADGLGLAAGRAGISVSLIGSAISAALVR
jgi:hypothetical protein